MSHRRMLAGLLLWTLLAAGCGQESPDDGSPDAGQVDHDSGARPKPPVDAGSGCDSGTCTDAGVPPLDGGPDCVTALCTDAGSPPEDAGSGCDSGACTDGGVPPEEDGGTGCDAGGCGDAGVPARPTVLSTAPAAEASGVDVRPVVSVRFSEPMRGAELTRETFTLMHEGTPVVGSVEAALDEASFRPEGRLTLLGRYTALVDASVSSDRGVPLGEAHRWSFRVRDGRWGRDTRLGSLPASDYKPQPHVAFDGAGRALAIWAGNDGSRHGVWVREHVPGQGWGQAVAIGPTGGEEALTPQLVIGPEGRALAVWFQRQPQAQAFLWYSQRGPGGAWTEARRVDPEGFGDGTTVQLAVGSSGRAVAAWTQFDFDTFSENVWVASLDLLSGTQWSRAERIDVDELNYTFDLRLDMNAAGQAMAVWYRFDGARGSVWARQYTPGDGGGQWGPPERLEDDDAPDATMPAVALEEDGKATVVWMQTNARGAYTVFSRRYVPAEGWGAPQVIDLDQSGHSIEPRVLHLGGGHVLAAWSKYDGQRNNILANHFQPGSGWGAPRFLEEDDVAPARHPALARDAAGNALAVWEQGDGTRVRGRAARFIRGQGWGPAAVLGAGDGTGNAAQPRVSIGPDGSGFACWAESDGTQDHAVIVPFD